MPLFLLRIIVYTRYTWKRVIWKSLLHAISGREENLQNLHLCHLKLFLFIYLFIYWCFWTVVLKTVESPLDCKEIQPAHPKGDQSWEGLMRSWNSNTLATSCEELTLWKRPWCWGRLRAGGEGDSRGWDGWMASPTQWTWVWVDSGSWWWTGRPGVLQFMGSQGVGHDWATELNWTGLCICHCAWSSWLLAGFLCYQRAGAGAPP